MNNLMIIGQYVPSNSLIHRLDPRTKMVIIFLFIFSVFLANNLWSYVTLVAFAFLSIALSRVPTRFIVKGLTPVWFLIAFTFIAMALGRDIRRKLFTHVESFALQEFDGFGTASLITRTTNDITQIQQVTMMLLRMMVTAPLMFTGGFIMAFSKDPKLSLVI